MRQARVPRSTIVDLVPLISSVIKGRVHDRQVREDLVQEAVVRLIEAEDRLERRTLASYAAVTARNLAISHHRAEQVRRRHAHRLLEADQPPRPDEEVERAEERQALQEALVMLKDEDKLALIEHEVLGLGTARVAERLGTSPGAVATRLARARAKLRVEYLLALRNVRLPTPRCKGVLVAISAADARRQMSLDAAGHLAECPTCARHCEELLHRRRPLAAWLPVLPLLKAKNALRTPVGQAAAASVGVAVVAVVVAARGPGPPPPAPPERPARLPQGITLQAAGKVTATNATVQSVPSDEGFWAGSGARDRIWVTIQVTGESGDEVERGERASFTGRVEPHGRGYAQSVGVSEDEGAADLARVGWHVVVREDDLRVTR